MKKKRRRRLIKEKQEQVERSSKRVGDSTLTLHLNDGEKKIKTPQTKTLGLQEGRENDTERCQVKGITRTGSLG